jgi:hypothetical protein
MPDRVIRDELLTSERYWSVSIEAQRLFIHILLNVDDVARFSGKNYTIRSACFPGQAIEPAKVEKLLSELQDIDLVRLYEVSNERFIFVPRFKQRLRFTKSRYPEPPREINDIAAEKTGSSQTQVSPESDSSRQKRSEVKRSEVTPPLFAEFWSAYPKRKNRGQAEKAWQKLKPNEQLFAEILQGIERAKTSEFWRKESGRFIPFPATWLNAKGWLDEDEQTATIPRYVAP